MDVRSFLAEDDIIDIQKEVSYDTKEFTVELLVEKMSKGEISIPPYQRAFVWSKEKQSKFIESLIMGLPIPFLFCNDNKDGDLELIDGTQRIRTLKAFFNNEFSLKSLEKIEILEGFKFQDLPKAQQKKLKNRTLRMIVMENVDEFVCFDIFERINTGSDNLKDSETRKGAYGGAFYDIVLELSKDSLFISMAKMSDKVKSRGEREELVLRFFAYGDEYLDFKHDVRKFLDKYTKKKNAEMVSNPELVEEYKTRFHTTMAFVNRYFQFGFTNKGRRQTPRVRYEAIAVGSYLALREKPALVVSDIDWISSKEFSELTTTHGSNNSNRLKLRVEYVKNKLLEACVDA